MNLTATWFIINLFFVAAFIFMLFLQRAVTMAKMDANKSEQVVKLKKYRTFSIVITVLLFIAMSAVFIMNMMLNG